MYRASESMAAHDSHYTRAPLARQVFAWVASWEAHADASLLMPACLEVVAASAAPT